MAQGVLSGIGIGAVFSVAVAGVVSVLVPIEPQPAPQLGTAETVVTPQPGTPQPSVTVTGEAGSPAPQPRISLRTPAGEDLPKEPTAAALAPQVATELGADVDPAPLADASVSAPATETAALAPQPAPLTPVQDTGSDATPQVPAALPQPSTGGVDRLPEPRPLPPLVTARINEDLPVLPNPQALAPMIPDDSVDGQVSVEGTQAETAPQQQGEETFVIVPPAQDALPQQDAGTDTQIAQLAPAPKPRVVPAPGTLTTNTGTATRPRIGTPATTLITSNDQIASVPVETATQAPLAPASLPPLQRYAQPFNNPEGKPLMSIVLMDTGVDLDAAEIGLPALSSFPYPVSFAVDVRLIDAAARMERYRAEGFDVLAMVNLPNGARPEDAEVSLSVALNGLPEVVGVLEGTGEGLQGSRDVADQVTKILKASGHGLVAQSKGLNSMPKLALKEGVPAAAVFRDFDSQGQQPRVIRRFLDQAAFKAGQEGGVIMLGRLRPETIEALLVWGLADRAGSVALAPVSAVLLAQ